MQDTVNKVKIVTFIPLALYTDTENDHYASLTWSIRMGYPRMSVYTDNTRDKREDFSYNKLIIAPLDGVTVNIVIAELEKIIANPTESRFAIKCYNTKYVNNEKTNDVALQATIIVGRDKEGVIYLSAVAADKKKVKFKLLPNNKWHKLVNAAGDEITDLKELSTTHAKAYCARLKTLMDKFIVDDTAVKFTDKKGANTPKVSNNDLAF